MASLLDQIQEWIPALQMGYPYSCHVALVTFMFGIPWKLGLKDWEWFKNTFVSMNKYVLWAHGILTFSAMWVCQPRNLQLLSGGGAALLSPQFLQQGMASLLAITLWDFGYVYFNGISMALINCHHIGLFLAMLFGPGWNIETFIGSDEGQKSDLERQVVLDTYMFGWLWLIHSFGFLLEVILPLIVRVKLKKGSRSKSVDAIKYAYSLGTVYFFHRYLNENPDRFFTYQTSSLLVMLTGRYLVNNNWKNVDFFRRIEFPGFWIVLADRVLGFHDAYCFRTLFLAVALFAAYVLHAVFFKKMLEKPLRYAGPKENPDLRKFLEDETPAVCGASETGERFDASISKFCDMRNFCAQWFNNEKTEDGSMLKDMYPVHSRIFNSKPGDRKTVEDLAAFLDNGGDKHLEQPLKELDEAGPLQCCASNKYSYECALLLLKRGANPYQEDARGCCAIQQGLEDRWGISPKPGALGFSEGFWDRFNAICLEKSPSKGLSRKERFLQIVQSF